MRKSSLASVLLSLAAVMWPVTVPEWHAAFGAKEVHMACLESRETMPAVKDELEEVEKDGV